jgi:acyl-CoA synthetase (AMP-forming)/AMP-acid ligase II
MNSRVSIPNGTLLGDTYMAVGNVAQHVARYHPALIALRDGERTLSYAEFNKQVNALAAGLIGLGIRKGDVVAAYLPNCIEYVLVVLSVARAGAIFSPINPRYKFQEVGDIFERAKPRAIFTTSERLAIVTRAATDGGIAMPAVILTDADVAIPSTFSFEELAQSAPCPLPVVSADDAFSLMFTSGTTGKPKGALSTHRARMLWVLNAAILYGLRRDDIYLGIMPQVHSAGLTFSLMHLYVGATIEILRNFDPLRYLELVETRRITSSLTVPTMLSMIVEELGKAKRGFDLSCLRLLLSCGSPLEPKLKQAVLEQITPHLYDYYGSTESNSMSVLEPQDQLRKMESVGQPFPNVELMIRDEQLAAVPSGNVGTIWCRGPSVMREYLGQPEETDRVLIDGWYRTGDLGRLDDEGFLYITGREKEVIISGGVNIYPREIEQVLMRHPGVLDCAVVGVPDAKWGRTVAAYVVPRDGCDLTLQVAQEFVTQHLADYKKPRKLMILSELPKNAGGKTVKTALPPIPNETSTEGVSK